MPCLTYRHNAICIQTNIHTLVFRTIFCTGDCLLYETMMTATNYALKTFIHWLLWYSLCSVFVMCGCMKAYRNIPISFLAYRRIEGSVLTCPVICWVIRSLETQISGFTVWPLNNCFVVVVVVVVAFVCVNFCLIDWFWFLTCISFSNIVFYNCDINVWNWSYTNDI